MTRSQTPDTRGLPPLQGGWDVGLQPERTELAWRRTVISLAVLSLGAIRLLPAIYGSWLLALPGVVGVSCSAVIWQASRHRHHVVDSALHEADADTSAPSRPVLPDGRLLLLTAAVATTIGIVGLVALAHAFR